MTDTVFGVWDNDKKQLTKQTNEGEDILLNLSTGKLCALTDDAGVPPNYYVTDLDEERYVLTECIRT